MTDTDLVKSIVDKRIGKLQNGYRRNESSSVAALARLRRGVGKPPGSVLDILEFTYAKEFVADPRSDEPTPAEIAAHLAMTLYALHQQSQHECMHQRGHRHRLGRAIRTLITDKSGISYVEHSVARRFAMLGTADSLDELVHHLRGMVQLLRTNGEPLDYGLLTADLLRWQRPGGPAAVRLGWGRDFHLSPKKTATPANTTP